MSGLKLLKVKRLEAVHARCQLIHRRRIGVVSIEWLLAVITVLFPGSAMVEHFGGE
jgi:hypothetical protein